MLSGLICAFVEADCDDKYGAVTAALSCMKSAGAVSYTHLKLQEIWHRLQTQCI